VGGLSSAGGRLNGYTTNLAKVSPKFVIDTYYWLWRVEKAFWMSNTTYSA
jgi:hypothetical protein